MSLKEKAQQKLVEEKKERIVEAIKLRLERIEYDEKRIKKLSEDIELLNSGDETPCKDTGELRGDLLM